MPATRQWLDAPSAARILRTSPRRLPALAVRFGLSVRHGDTSAGPPVSCYLKPEVEALAEAWGRPPRRTAPWPPRFDVPAAKAMAGQYLEALARGDVAAMAAARRALARTCDAFLSYAPSTVRVGTKGGWL